MGLFSKKPEPVEGCAARYGFPDPHRIAVLLLEDAGYSEHEVRSLRADYYAGADNVYHVAVTVAMTHIWSHTQLKSRPVDQTITMGAERGDFSPMLDRWCHPLTSVLGTERIQILAGKICPGGTYYGRPVEAEYWPEALRLWHEELAQNPQVTAPGSTAQNPEPLDAELLDAGVDLALDAFRSGERATGLDLVERVCAQRPSDVSALALAAYELRMRADSEHEFNRGTGYLRRLEQVAPESTVLHSLKAIASLTSDLTQGPDHLKAAKSGVPGTSAEVDLLLFTLADLAASEASYQIMIATPGEDLRLTVTHRMKGVILLLEKRSEEALAEFRAGIDDADTRWANVPTRVVPLADRPKCVANLRRDCRFGQWLALLDLGRLEEAAEVLADARARYQHEYHAAGGIGDDAGTMQPGGAADPGLPPPDWYPDPSETGRLRYWDGTQWTGHTAG